MNNREVLHQTIEAAGITQKRAADLLSAATGDHVAERTIRRWLADPLLPSARPCPGWAVTLLAEALKNTDRKKET